VVRIWGLSLDWVHQNLFVSSVPKPRLSFIDGKQDGTQPGSSYTGVLPIRWTRTLPFLESCKIRGYATVDLCSPSLDPSFSGISVSAVCTKVRSHAFSAVYTIYIHTMPPAQLAASLTAQISLLSNFIPHTSKNTGPYNASIERLPKYHPLRRVCNRPFRHQHVNPALTSLEPLGVL
jgi:hypothetical protein